MLYIFFILSLCNASNDKSIDFLLDAETFMLLEEYSSAEKKYIKALNYSPNNTSILISLYEASLYQGKINSAEKYIYKAYILNKQDLDILKKYYKILLVQNDNDKALKILNKAIEISKEDLNLYYDKVKILFEINNWNELIQVYSKIYSMNQDDNLLDQMHDISIATDNIDILINTLEKVYNLNRSRSVIMKLISITFNYNLNLCKKYLLELLEDDQHNFDLNLLLAQVYLNNGEYSSSLKTLRVVENKFDSIKFHKLMLLLYRKLNDINMQIEVSENIIENYPNKRFGYDSLILLYIRNSDYKNAFNTITLLKKVFPKEKYINYYLGLLKDINNEILKARDYYYKALDGYPKSKEIIFSLALNYENNNIFFKSDSLFKIFIGDNPSPSDKNDYAYIISQRENINTKRLRYLLELSLETLEHNSKSPEFLDTVGFIYYKLGNINKSIYYLELSIKYDNNNIIILSHLLDSYYRVNNFIKTNELINKIENIDSTFLINKKKYYILK